MIFFLVFFCVTILINHIYLPCYPLNLSTFFCHYTLYSSEYKQPRIFPVLLHWNTDYSKQFWWKCPDDLNYIWTKCSFVYTLPENNSHWNYLKKWLKIQELEKSSYWWDEKLILFLFINKTLPSILFVKALRYICEPQKHTVLAYCSTSMVFRASSSDPRSSVKS